MDLTKALQKYFSFQQFRIGQKEIIQSVLNGKDTLASLPTGTGKSLCYQLPGYLLDGLVLIVSPLLSLMQDQVEQLKYRGEKRVAAINSFLTLEEKNRVLKYLKNYRFIYISPEMLQNERILASLKKIKISLLVIDEAHCISQWGYDFRPDYQELGDIRIKLGNPVTLALTATASPEVRADIKYFLHMEHAEEFIYSVDRPNISLCVEKYDEQKEKDERLMELVQLLKKPGIIYFSSKKKADEWAEKLNGMGLKAASYHSGQEQEQRILLQQQFLFNELSIMCATSAFGMGINKENIRFIIHYHPPLQIESYLQEIGRAGRDGQKSIAILLYNEQDRQLLRQLIEQELPTIEQIEKFPTLINNPHLLEYNSIPEGFTEVQWRLLLKFYQNSKNTDEFSSKTKKFIQSRYQWKKQKLLDVIKWIEAKGFCRRDRLLQFFSEKKESPIENCCDHCGLEWQNYFQVKKNDHELNEKENWQTTLAKIFNQ